MAVNDPVLVTGCSSGIGLATAQRLLAGGHTVYATARRLDALDDLARAGARVLEVDVTDEASMRAAVEAVEHEHGAVGALVNNAGYGAYGPVEEVGLDAVRVQFETNVFGLGRLCQLVLPGMRRAGQGRIVNISSMGGRLVYPTGGWYHASKYAVEALSDALRMEVRPFGVRVVLVEPGIIRTSFGDTASHGLAAGEEGSAYGGLRSYAEELLTRAYASRAAAGPDAVAAAVVRAVETPRPRPRYVVTAAARAQVHTRRLAGDRVWDALMRQAYRLR
jgi:NAD(P)-dependent dehydrogenase (short-subunit alcohol dehydrogenase family)